MAVRPILIYGDPRLEAVNLAVTEFDATLHEVVEDLFETGWKAPGLGVAAPQIGVNLRLATIDISVGKDPSAKMVLANPEIVTTTGTAQVEEGCLSFPGLFTTLRRPLKLRARAQNRYGDWWEVDAEGLLAQAICHELDHLDGVLLVHHLHGLKRQMFLRRVAKMRRLGVWRETA